MKAPANNSDLTRRGFFALAAGWVASVCGGLAAATGAVRFLVPNVLYEPDMRFRIGRPGDYADGSVTFLESQKVFLLRQGNTFRCVSAICSHLGCTIDHAGSGFHCPCHGSSFDGQGRVTGGPAPRGLTWHLVTLGKDEHLMIDKGQQVESDKYLVL
jgi:cytochrome b6-f complex iron-sulfur subunit